MGANNAKSEDALKRKTATEHPTSNPELYLDLIEEERKIVEKLMVKDADEEHKWLRDLPYHEQLEIMKEQNVLVRWQERQRDWEKIESRLIQRVDPKQTAHKLMMDSDRQNEFRVETEKYRVMMQAFPDEERFNSSNWTQSLRDGGVTIAQVGHLFSGLQCKIMGTHSVPPIVRKPRVKVMDALSGATGSYTKSVSATKMQKSVSTVLTKTYKQIAMDIANKEHPDLVRKARKIKKAMAELRREVAKEEVEGLFFKAIDLYPAHTPLAHIL